jgi:hypothetical protein
MRCGLIAVICFIIGGLIATLLTYQLGRCKTSQIIFRLQTPKTHDSSNAAMS